MQTPTSEICKARAFAHLIFAAALLGAANAHAGETAPEASACAALAGDDARLAAKFSLGKAACAAPRSSAGDAAAPAAQTPKVPSRGRHAQQLYLYERTAPVGAALPLTDLPRVDARPRPAAPAPAAKPDAALLRALRLAPAVDAVARSYDIDPLLLHAIARVESRHNPAAVSHAGARGLMQVMPATAGRFGVHTAGHLHDAPVNLEVSAAYLKTLQRRFGNDLTLVLAAYNAGEGAVERHGRRVPPYAETRGYVRQVLGQYTLLRAAGKAEAPR